MRYGKKKLTTKQIMTDPVMFLAFGFGTGLAKKAPGTFRTLAAIPIYLLLTLTNSWLYSLTTLIIIISGIWICDIAAKRLGVHDFGGIVWDEIAGFLVTLWFVPFSWQAVMIGFILFRLFDIFKPWPIRKIDRELPGGLGIMMDDILAGIYAWIVVMLLISAGL